MPAAHVLQKMPPGRLWYLDFGHRMQLVEMDFAVSMNWPALQILHWVCPALGWTNPALQSKQMVLAADEENIPFGQILHCAWFNWS
jgi:hypothetical protein